METPIKYTDQIVVRSLDLDELQHVNNTVYLNWVQDIAKDHWYAIFPDSDIKEAYWVVIEHHIQYKGSAFNGDVLTIETYVEPPKGLRFPRIVNIYKNDKLIVTCKTIWCWVETKTGRPKRVSNDVLIPFFEQS